MTISIRENCPEGVLPLGKRSYKLQLADAWKLKNNPDVLVRVLEFLRSLSETYYNIDDPPSIQLKAEETIQNKILEKYPDSFMEQDRDSNIYLVMRLTRTHHNNLQHRFKTSIKRSRSDLSDSEGDELLDSDANKLNVPARKKHHPEDQVASRPSTKLQANKPPKRADNVATRGGPASNGCHTHVPPPPLSKSVSPRPFNNPQAPSGPIQRGSLTATLGCAHLVGKASFQNPNSATQMRSTSERTKLPAPPTGIACVPSHSNKAIQTPVWVLPLPPSRRTLADPVSYCSKAIQTQSNARPPMQDLPWSSSLI